MPASSQKVTRKSYRRPQVDLEKLRSVARSTRASRQDSPPTIPIWTSFDDKNLLQLKICDLGVSLETPSIQKAIQTLYSELEHRKLKFRPHVWLSDEWYSPDGIPGIAMPFYLAHPRLMRLERKQMLEVEGGTRNWCLKILRHETGHAFDTAFRLHRRKKYRELFGRYNEPYPEVYRPDPTSRDYVHHLEPWYAQSHPSEDFAETFAVWLKPRSRWRSIYKDWPAIKKLEYVDEIMSELCVQQPVVKSRRKIDPVHRIKKTLGDHYVQKRQYYGYDMPTNFDHALKKLFSATTGKKTAAAFLQKHRSEFSRMVATWTGECRYNVNQVIREMIDRCRELNLRADHEDDSLKQNTLVMLSVHTVNFLHGGHHPVAL